MPSGFLRSTWCALPAAGPPKIYCCEALIGLAILISALFWVGTLVAVPLIIVWLPVDYLSAEPATMSLVRRKAPLWRYPYWIAKNVVGAIFIVAGIAMLFLPGQGILTIVLGLALINFPGKRKVIRRIFGNRHIFKTINRLREKAKKPPLEKPRPES